MTKVKSFLSTDDAADDDAGGYDNSFSGLSSRRTKNDAGAIPRKLS